MADAAAAPGWGARVVTTSPLPGPSGNVEFFLWLRRGPADRRRGRRAAEVERAALLGAPGERVDP